MRNSKLTFVTIRSQRSKRRVALCLVQTGKAGTLLATDSHWSCLRALVSEFGEPSGNFFFDVHTAALMREHGIRRIASAHKDFAKFFACALTSQEPRAGFPLTFELNRGKLPNRSWVKISQIRTLSVKRLGKKIGTASVEELEQVIEGLNEIVGA